MAETPAEIQDVARLVDARIRTLLDEERTRWAEIDERLTEAIDELDRMAQGGKRLRAAFCYHAWLGAGGDLSDNEAIVDAGAAFELLQTFALIHDDIMDAASTRRGETTIHVAQARRVEALGWKGEARRHGEGVALLVGDLSHVYADQLIGMHSFEARRLWDLLRIELNLGQYLDMRAAASGELDRETAQRVATFKSALYTIVRPMQLGAALAQPEPDIELQRQLEAVGIPVGQAFQLRDDLLGVLGDASHVGKPVGNDLREGKATELVAIALQRANDSQRDVLGHIGQPDLGAEQADAILDVFEATGAISEVEQRIDDLVAQATDSLAALPFDPEHRQVLASLANYAASRTH